MIFFIPIPRGSRPTIAFLGFGCMFVMSIVGSFLVIGGNVAAEYKVEQNYRQQFGADWVAHYEQRYGPGSLQRAHTKMIIGVAFLPVIITIVALLARLIKGPNHDDGRHRGRKRSSRRNNKW